MFAKLYAETLNPIYLRNIGRCHQKLKQPDKAIDAFHDYLPEGGKKISADEKAEINGYIKDMEALRDEQASQQQAAPPPVPGRAGPADSGQPPGSARGAAARLRRAADQRSAVSGAHRRAPTSSSPPGRWWRSRRRQPAVRAGLHQVVVLDDHRRRRGGRRGRRRWPSAAGRASPAALRTRWPVAARGSEAAMRSSRCARRRLGCSPSLGRLRQQGFAHRRDAVSAADDSYAAGLHTLVVTAGGTEQVVSLPTADLDHRDHRGRLYVPSSPPGASHRHRGGGGRRQPVRPRLQGQHDRPHPVRRSDRLRPPSSWYDDTTCPPTGGTAGPAGPAAPAEHSACASSAPARGGDAAEVHLLHRVRSGHAGGLQATREPRSTRSLFRPTARRW